MPPLPEKRQVILDAARKVLAQKGLRQATISQVADKAGVSRGLLHYYFKNKDEMLSQVVAETVERSMMLARKVLADCRPGQDLAHKLGQGFSELLRHDPDFYHIFFEAWVLARRNAQVAGLLKAQYRKLRQGLAQDLRDAAARGVIAPSRPMEATALLVIGLMDGLLLQLQTEPELAESQEFWEAVRQGLKALLG